MTRIEDVFKVTGVPTYTFVEPAGYNALKVGLRTPGRGVVIEGPSGIGKSTTVSKALEELGLESDVLRLSARVPADAEYIELLDQLASFGTVVIDDLHRLEPGVRNRIADLLKVTADQEDPGRKLVVIGINEAGQGLIEAAPDLSNRIDVIRFETETPTKIAELVTAGEAAANVSIAARDLIIERASGSFYIAQLLCLEACIEEGVLEVPVELKPVVASYAAIQRKVVARQRARFGTTVRDFARGTKFRPSGRAPYLHVLRWLAESDSWSISIPEEMRKHASEKASVGVVFDRGYLRDLCTKPEVAKLVHLGPTGTLSVEDPMLVYFLRAISWPEFVKEVGFTNINYTTAYDVALSFAGEDREYAEHLRDSLEDAGHVVFYDFNEQHLIIGEDVEAYLAPVYQTGCRYVVAILGEMYGLKRWTLFEASQYKDRIEEGAVIPIWNQSIPISAFDPIRGRGGLSFDPTKDLRSQAADHAQIISRKLAINE